MNLAFRDAWQGLPPRAAAVTMGTWWLPGRVIASGCQAVTVYG